jgi:non-ribosomal peptide synthetase component F
VHVHPSRIVGEQEFRAAESTAEGAFSPLSLAQLRLCYDSHSSRPDMNHIVVRSHISGLLDREALRWALDSLVRRHEVLRTIIREAGGEPLQIVESADFGFALIPHDVCSSADIERLWLEEISTPFDLRTGPLIRGRLLRSSDEQHVLIVSYHRLVGDRASLALLSSELGALYCGAAGRTATRLPAPACQFRDYACWQRRRITKALLRAQLEFWKRKLIGAPRCLRLPRDHTGSAPPYSTAQVQLGLTSEVSALLRTRAEELGVTIQATLIAAWGALLGRWSAQQEIVLGLRGAAHKPVNADRVVGPLENLVLLRVALSEDVPTRDLLGRIDALMEEARAHEDVPFEDVLDELRTIFDCDQKLQVVIGFDEAPTAPAVSRHFQPSDLVFTELRVNSATIAAELSLSLALGGSEIVGTLEYARELYERRTIERLIDCWTHLLYEMIAAPEVPIDRLSITTGRMRRELLEDFNEHSVSNLQEGLLHDLFERQVEATPHAIAITSKGRHLTYAQLNRRANAFAAYLHERGVRPEILVGICARPGIELIVAVLGVLKAGGAYVALDPTSPVERILPVITDSRLQVLLAHGSWKTGLSQLSCEVLPLEAALGAASKLSAGDFELDQPTPANLACVLYDPAAKSPGVMIEHRQIARVLTSVDERLHFTQLDKWSMSHQLASGVCLLELWGSLLFGGHLHIPCSDLPCSPARFHDLLCRTRINVLCQTGDEFRQLMAAQVSRDQPSSLQMVVLLGAGADAAAVAQWYARNPRARPQFHRLYALRETSAPLGLPSMSRHERPGCTDAPQQWLPLSHSRIYITDDHLHPLPIGAVGHICLGGAGVPRGYINDAPLTQKRFGPDPFDRTRTGRIYRTGELGRWRADGTIEHVGFSEGAV